MRIHIRNVLCAALAALVLLAVPLRPAAAQDIATLYLFDDLFAIMADEGIASAGDADATPLAPEDLGQWRAELARIYDSSRMSADFTAALDNQLAQRPDIRADAIAFAQSELGARVLQLEVTARKALLDDEIDEMARLVLAEARDAAPGSDMAKRLALVRERVAVNDLVELNVSLGLNTTYAYYDGMLSQAEVPGLGAQDVLSLVWSQEEDIRTDVTDWIESYFLMAYQPLTTEELETYIDFSASAGGDGFNRMMFQAFDAVFVDISRQVGAAMGRALSGETLSRLPRYAPPSPISANSVAASAAVAGTVMTHAATIPMK